MNFGLGWRVELEARHAKAFAGMCRSSPLPGNEKIPPSLDPRAAMVEFGRNQSFRSTCSGHARAKAAGFCNMMETGVYKDISPRFAYISNLKMDGNLQGGDNGASISGSALGSKTDGECLETDCPYWLDSEEFSTAISADVYAKALLHRTASAQKINSCEEGLIGCGLNQGAMILGIDWTSDLASNTSGIITAQRGRSLGGHAICWYGYAAHEGALWPIIWNSHGRQWGQNGTAIVHPRLMDRWCQGYFGVYMVSDLAEFTERPRDFGDFRGVFGKGLKNPWNFKKGTA